MKPALLTLDDFREQYFAPKSRPCKQTIYNWVKSGAIPVRRIGRMIYVDMVRFESSTGSALVDRILSGHK
jgi:hypothetical protein